MAQKLAQKDLFAQLCDGSEIYSVVQAARYLNAGKDAIQRATKQGALSPARIAGAYVYTRRDLDRFRRLEREGEITRQLVAGDHPLDVYLANPGKYALRDVTRVMLDWARLSGVWLVEGPRGSYARWLARLGVVRCTPRELRRVVEALATDPTLGAKVRGLFIDQRTSEARAIAAKAG